MSTLHAVFKRRRVESSLAYTTLKEKVDMCQVELESRKALLEVGKGEKAEYWNRILICAKTTLGDAVSDLKKVHQAIQDYATNEDLRKTLGPETRGLVAKDHKRMLSEMRDKCDDAETRLQDAEDKFEEERKEAKRRIKEDETKLASMKADLELAHTERGRWGCIENLAAMGAHDVKRVLASLEKEDMRILECPEEQGPRDNGVGGLGKHRAEPDAH